MIAVVNDDFTRARRIGSILRQGALKNEALKNTIRLFRSGQFAQLYQDWIGSVGLKPSPMLVAMYQVQALSE